MAVNPEPSIATNMLKCGPFITVLVPVQSLLRVYVVGVGVGTAPTATVPSMVNVTQSVPVLFVISRNTAFTYRNKPVNVKQIGRELGVRYLLEGSIRSSGEPAPRQRRADRRRDRCASLGGSIRPRHRRSVRLAKRNHQPDREHPRHRADRCGRPLVRPSVPMRSTTSPRARRRVEAAVARELCRAD
jgi:hypothetical protein